MNFELAKLIYDLNWSEIDAFKVYNIRKKLSPTWFEYYIKFYFEKILWYKTKFQSLTNKPDWWIDIKWIKINSDGQKEYCIVQCKRNSNYITWIKDIRDFVGGIYRIMYSFPNTNIYYITTSDFTPPAITFANQEWVSLKNFSNILNIYNQYSIEEFEKDIKLEEPKKYKKIFNKWRKLNEPKRQWKLFISEEDEILKTLRDIRYSLMKKNHIHDSNIVCSSNVLEYISKKRPHNLKSLKNVLKEWEFSDTEVAYALYYGKHFLKWINLFTNIN